MQITNQSFTYGTGDILQAFEYVINRRAYLEWLHNVCDLDCLRNMSRRFVSISSV